MEVLPAGRLAAEIHFATARGNLRALVALVPVRGPDVPPGMVGAAVATSALDGVAHALDENADDAARVACPFCKGPGDARGDLVRIVLAQARRLTRQLSRLDVSARKAI